MIGLHFPAMPFPRSGFALPFSGAALALAALLAFCRASPEPRANALARDYVLLALALGTRDPGYVESYYGPEEWRAEAGHRVETTASIGFESGRLLKRLHAFEPKTDIERRRLGFLRRQLESLQRRVDLVRGDSMSFDEETKVLYGGIAPHWSEAELASRLEGLDRLLEGDGPLLARFQIHQHRYVVPANKLATVFEAAIEECRRRTTEHIDLPAGESYRLELVKGKPWAAYSWYQGSYESLIELNSGFSLTIDSMIDLACHEVYPGHHTMQVLLESRLVRSLGWQEYTVTPLFSPFSAFSEGLAEIGVELVFPSEDRRRFEREVLFPLAGLATKDYEHYDAVRREAKKLRAAQTETARRYLDRELTGRQARDWLQTYALTTDVESALRFVTIYRSHVASYEVGERMMRDHLEGRAETSEKWEVFEQMLTAGSLFLDNEHPP